MNMNRLFMLLLIYIGFIPSMSHAQSCSIPDQCLPGFVWRDAFPGDKVCVTEQTRKQAADDNALAATKIDPKCAAGNCSYGVGQCLPGYVWREASTTDFVCVSGDVRTLTRADNAAASSRVDPKCVFPPVDVGGICRSDRGAQIVGICPAGTTCGPRQGSKPHKEPPPWCILVLWIPAECRTGPGSPGLMTSDWYCDP